MQPRWCTFLRSRRLSFGLIVRSIREASDGPKVTDLGQVYRAPSFACAPEASGTRNTKLRAVL